MNENYFFETLAADDITTRSPFGNPLILLFFLLIAGVIIFAVRAHKKKSEPVKIERKPYVGDNITTVDGVTGQIIALQHENGEIKIKDSVNGLVIKATTRDILINHTIKAEQGAAQQGQSESAIYKSLPTHILLCIFTFGIWYFIWIYRATIYLNRAPEGERYDPTKKLLLCLFVPFYQIYWFYKHGQKLDSLMKQRNIGGGDMATLCLILGIVFPLVACILMQDKLNQLCTVTTAPVRTDAKSKPEQQAAPDEAAAIDYLKQYKELLDSGAITQEEFDAKKKQILGL